ncbi:flagellar basal-body rod protein FlgF [Pelotalea chapellei]|uniref:Flagellar basal-body rod protein FlgF n=1 Tax=Pelotalea chapellei TaxID=44671 RepID=A0ABS5U8F5_9BACT|nr:flagellar basal-body rod protein FlgF [Pelotalea chapellei]MBT1071930.1 flagellar basal-body rod protein FlgF [Pelotalea chapellei]
MNSGMYSALSGNLAAMKRLDIISNNLANVNTPGYKKEKMSFESMLAGSANPPAVPQGTTADPILQKENVYIDYVAGPVAQTGNPLDLTIDGEGFFVIQTPEGEAYTRQGNFSRGADGTLVTADGFPVMGRGGAIRVQGSHIEIDAKGVVTVDGTVSGTINVVDFPKPYNLVKTSSARFLPADSQITPQPSTAGIRQGNLEGSNVEAISEMVQMIETSRYFEACSKVIKGYDDIAAKAVNELGRL